MSNHLGCSLYLELGWKQLYLAVSGLEGQTIFDPNWVALYLSALYLEVGWIQLYLTVSGQSGDSLVTAHETLYTSPVFGAHIPPHVYTFTAILLLYSSLQVLGDKRHIFVSVVIPLVVCWSIQL